jgi:hypothetical protein
MMRLTIFEVIICYTRTDMRCLFENGGIWSVWSKNSYVFGLVGGVVVRELGQLRRLLR